MDIGTVGTTPYQTYIPPERQEPPRAEKTEAPKEPARVENREPAGQLGVMVDIKA
ncbi:MAG TPA: hypothetical protein PKK26_15260 [Candidatus Wallbacteria bacterium]|nr:hypothetical protein [Candidatus Wallbacteria bacterium]